jgi:hypothetical protein
MRARRTSLEKLVSNDPNVWFGQLVWLRKGIGYRGEHLADHGFAATDMGAEGDQVHAGLLKGSLGKLLEGTALLFWLRHVHVFYI